MGYFALPNSPSASSGVRACFLCYLNRKRRRFLTLNPACSAPKCATSPDGPLNPNSDFRFCSRQFTSSGFQPVSWTSHCQPIDGLSFVSSRRVRMKLSFRCSLLLCFVLFLLQCATGERSLRRFKFEALNLFPESFDWDRSHDRFLVGSMFHGTISVLSSDGSSLTEFIRDEEYAGRAAVSGVKVDGRRNRVIVTVVDAVSWIHGGVAAYDLDTKERVYFAYLDGVGVAPGEKLFPNDLALNFKTGDVYVTNSFGNFLWKVTKDGTPSVFVKHENFSQPIIVEDSEYGFNGIVYEPMKYLLAVQTNSGALFRVGVEDRSIHKVIVKENFPMADGMLLREDGTLVIVSAEKVWLVGSASNWMAANVVDTVALNVSDATTAAATKRGYTFILHSYLPEMSAQQSREEFVIREIEFPAELGESDPMWLIVLIVLAVVVVSLWRFQMGHFYEKHRRKNV